IWQIRGDVVLEYGYVELFTFANVRRLVEKLLFCHVESSIYRCQPRGRQVYTIHSASRNAQTSATQGRTFATSHSLAIGNLVREARTFQMRNAVENRQ